jgi:AbrB family looped-hinge helix DNA binding protein
MSIATVTSKGQVTIPHEVRERFGIVAGTRLEFVEVRGGVLQVVPRSGSIMDLQGIVPWEGPAFTVEQMDEGIAQHVAEQDRLSRE